MEHFWSLFCSCESGSLLHPSSIVTYYSDGHYVFIDASLVLSLLIRGGCGCWDKLGSAMQQQQCAATCVEDNLSGMYFDHVL